LTEISVRLGLDANLAAQVATTLMAHECPCARMPREWDSPPPQSEARQPLLAVVPGFATVAVLSRC